MQRIALVTYRGAPGLSEDDRLALPHLSRRGVDAVPAAWDAPCVRWNDFDGVVIRSCWDYHRRPEAFRQWLAAVEKNRTRVWNPAPVVRWNMEKRYLEDLRDAGTRIVPTVWVEAGAKADLGAILRRQGWDRAVVKPAISASAYRTWLTSRESAERDRTEFEDLIGNTVVMVQEYFPEIESEGEWSLLFFAGTYSHAVRKRPKRGDFRVQEELGGTVEPLSPPDALIDQTRKILGAAPGFPHLYARADGLVRNDIFHMMELELIEPSLFLGWDPGAADRFAARIVEAVADRPAPSVGDMDHG